LASVVHQRAAAGRDHRRFGRLRQGRDHFAFEPAKSRLAVFGKDLGDRLARARHYFMVAVDEAAAQPRRQRPSDRALSGRHEAGQD
jgi:hypothetical protein